MKSFRHPRHDLEVHHAGGIHIPTKRPSDEVCLRPQPLAAACQSCAYQVARKRKGELRCIPPFHGPGGETLHVWSTRLINTYIILYQVEVQVARNVPVRGQRCCPPLLHTPGPSFFLDLRFAEREEIFHFPIVLLVTLKVLAPRFTGSSCLPDNLKSNRVVGLLRTKVLTSMKLKQVTLYTKVHIPSKG